MLRAHGWLWEKVATASESVKTYGTVALLFAVFACPPLIGVLIGLACAISAADGTCWLIGKSLEAYQRRREEKARIAKAAEDQRQYEEAERLRLAFEAAKPKPPTRGEKRDALEMRCIRLLKEIQLNSVMDATEKEAAKQAVKAKFLCDFDEVM